MMKIEVIRKIDYKGCPIYIRRIDKIFEYLVIYKGELFSQYFDIKPSWPRSDYTKKQLQGIIKLVLVASYSTIDKLNVIRNIQKNKKTQEKIKKSS